jgi:hypothetical protein
MGTTAQKLTYLDGTKTLLKDTINLTGANITNDTFRSYAQKLKLGLINALNDNGETIFNNLEKVSGKGSNLSLTPTYEAPIGLKGLYGNTSQNGTPTPSSPIPIESVTGEQDVEICGKNVYNTITSNDSFNQTTYKDFSNILEIKNNYGGISRTIETNTNYFKTTMTNTYDISQTWHFKNLLPNTQYTISCNVNINKTDGTVWLFESAKSVDTTSLIRNFTTNSNGEYSFTPMFYMQGTKTIGDYVELSNIQLEQGSTATTYEPYKGNTYEVNLGTIELNKTGDYQDSIKKSTGKNLFDIGTDLTSYFQTFQNGLVINATSINRTTATINGNKLTINSYDTTGWTWISKWVNLDKNTTYTISGKNTQAIKVVGFNSQELSTTGTLIETKSSSTQSISFNSGDYNYYCISFYPSASNEYFENILIEQNNQATSYEPYGKVWYITKNIGKVVLNGTEADSTYNTGTSGSFTRFGYLPFMSTDVCKIQSDYVSNYFKYLGAIGGDTTEEGISNTSVSGLNRLFIFLPTSTVSTIAQFKTWLTTHNTEIKYIQAKPTYTTITNTTLIEQLETLSKAKSKNGTTNIVITSQDLPMLMDVSVIKGDA